MPVLWVNLRYEKNRQREDVKSHDYIISLDPRPEPSTDIPLLLCATFGPLSWQESPSETELSSEHM